jgi:hypothetical protein
MAPNRRLGDLAGNIGGIVKTAHVDMPYAVGVSVIERDL